MREEELLRRLNEIADHAHRIANGGQLRAGQKQTVGALSRALRDTRDQLYIVINQLEKAPR